MTTRRQFYKAGYESNKLVKRLYRLTGKAVKDFNLIEEGDRVMVCVSGGKDSYTLLDLLRGLQIRAPVSFDLIAVHVDANFPGQPSDVLVSYFENRGIKYHIERQDVHAVIQRLIPEGRPVCSLCSRLRRGILYNVADRLGVTKIALGHHKNDAIETFFLNLFHGSKIKSMPAKLKTDDARHIVIRPLIYVREEDIARYSELQGHPVFPENSCGVKENPERARMKAMIADWDKKYPGRVDNIFNSLSNVVTTHLFDHALHGFTDLKFDPKARKHPLPDASGTDDGKTEKDG